MIRVMVVDDHKVVRAGVEAVLGAATDIDVVATASDGDEAVVTYRPAEVDVVLMDLSMPGVDGIEATRRIVAADPDARVVVLTSFADRTRVTAAIDAGATGYVLKDAEPEVLVDAVRSAARGEAPLDPRVAGALLERRRVPAAADLTDRETEVLVLVAEGLLNKQIARRLGISEKTVKTHLTNVFARLGVSDRTQAALWAERNGLTGAPPPERG